MKLARFLAPLALVAALSAGTLGVFRGKVVRSPAQQQREGWIFVQSPRGVLREVNVSQAHVTYSEEIPAARRSKSPVADLVPGSEVTVTAEQDGSGEWRASEVEIVRLNDQRAAR